jgi:hypothetical protein
MRELYTGRSQDEEEVTARIEEIGVPQDEGFSVAPNGELEGLFDMVQVSGRMLNELPVEWLEEAHGNPVEDGVVRNMSRMEISPNLLDNDASSASSTKGGPPGYMVLFSSSRRYPLNVRDSIVKGHG